MNDLEQRLKDMLDDDATKAPRVQRAPGQLRSKVRRRQVGTSVVAVLTATALVAATFIGFTVLDRMNEGPTPADPWVGYDVFERIATVGNFTVSSPSDWYLVDQGAWASQKRTRLAEQRTRELDNCRDLQGDARRDCFGALTSPHPGDGYVAPILMLSNDDLGLAASPCFDEDFALAPDDAVMTIALDNLSMVANFGAGDIPPWPVAFDAPNDEDRPSCGPGTYVHFASGDIPYIAHFAFGAGVSSADRETLITSFEALRVDDSLRPFSIANEQVPAYVLAGGGSASGPWSLELRPAAEDALSDGVDLQIVQSRGTSTSLSDSKVSARHPIEQAGGDPVFGTVVKEADGVDLISVDGGQELSANVVPVPPTIGAAFDVYFIENPNGVRGTAVPLGIETSPAPSATPDPTRVAEGVDLRQPWAVNYRTDGDDRCVLFQVGDVGEVGAFQGCVSRRELRWDPMLEAFPVPDGEGAFIWGLTSPEVASIAVSWIAPGVKGSTTIEPVAVGTGNDRAGVVVIPVPTSDGSVGVTTLGRTGEPTDRRTFSLTAKALEDAGEFRAKSRLIGRQPTYLWQTILGDQVCYRAFGITGSVESCAPDGAVASYVVSPTEGQVALVLQPAEEYTNKLRLVTDDGEIIRTHLCLARACVIRIPPGSGMGTTYTVQRAKPWTASSRLSWSPGGVAFA